MKKKFIRKLEAAINNALTVNPLSGRFAANGICTITTAITGVRFNMSSGNVSGTIKMYGIGG